MTEKLEELIVEAAQNGNLESFGILYERYYGSMTALAFSVLADRHLAEDAAQEAFAVACGELRRLRRRDRFAPWLAGICRNVARQMQRKRKHAIQNIPAPDENRENTDRIDEAVRRALWKLRPAHREVIILRYYNELSHAEISAILGISGQAVNGRLIRAKRRIAKYLKHDGIAGGDYE